jgi:putative oxidoreductase
MRMIKTIALWALQLLLGSMFVLAGVLKFQDPGWARSFARWGYPDGFYLVIGALEAAGGLALLVPRFVTYGAILLVTIMGGAALTHLVHGEFRRLSAPVVYLLLAGLIGWFRRKSALRLSAARREQAAVL